jgi:hypothetical protein
VFNLYQRFNFKKKIYRLSTEGKKTYSVLNNQDIPQTFQHVLTECIKEREKYHCIIKKSIHIRTNFVMGTAESKGNHRHRSSKYPHHKHERSTNHKCQHKNKQMETLTVGNKNSSKGKNETIGE